MHQRSAMMWTGLAFIALGYLVGNLTGLTAQSVVSPLLALIFTFAGGSAIGFAHKMEPDERRHLSLALLAFSVACLLGVYQGAWVSEHQLLSPIERRLLSTTSRGPAASPGSLTPIQPPVEDLKYLRSLIASAADGIDHQYKNGELTPDAAYAALRAAVLEKK